MSPTTRRLGMEKLEDRTVPSQFGNPWPNADRITISFAPDGTDVAGVQSNLSSALSGVGSTSVWKAEIARAFQTWAAATNMNFVVVSDNGSAFGSPGPVQGSPHVGDIRISARPLSDDVLAVATPPDLFSSWAGEIVINSNKAFSKGGAGGFDLYTVVLQEAGHALGVANSPDTASAMFTRYSAPRTGLAASDVAAIQALYGPRAADRFDADRPNDTTSDAAEIGYVKDGHQLNGTDGTGGKKPLVAFGDLTTLSDVDTYAFKNPKGSTAFFISALTDGLGQLKAKVSVIGPDGQLVAFVNEKTAAVMTSAEVEGTLDDLFQLKVENAQPDATYRIVVEGATEDVFGVGAYKLAVGHGLREALNPKLPTGYQNQDMGKNDSLKNATDLGTGRTTEDARWDFTYAGSIFNGSAADVDWYKVRTGAHSGGVGVVMLSSADASAFRGMVQVYDAQGGLLPTELVSQANGTVVLQFAGAVAGADYFVKVQAASPTQYQTGDYTLAVDFRQQAVTHTTFAAGTLWGDGNQAFTSFQLTRTQSVWFDLSGTADANVASRLTVYDANGVAVFSIGSKGGELAGGDVFLQPGTYTVRIVAAAQTGPLAGWDFRARYSLGSDPIGPALIEEPAPTGSPNPTPTTPTVYVVSSSTQTVSTFTGTSDIYTAPVGPTPTTDPLVWVAEPPPPTLLTSVQYDIYSAPWLW